MNYLVCAVTDAKETGRRTRREVEYLPITGDRESVGKLFAILNYLVRATDEIGT